jgi:hypothetical protein
LRKFRSSSHLTAVLVGGLAACAPSPPATLQPTPGATAAAIEADDLRTRVGLIADDSMRGRDTGTPGIEAAATYLASEMARLGLRPAGDNGSFFQAVPLERKTTRMRVTVEAPAESRSLEIDEIVPVSGLAGLPGTSRMSGSGPLVYGGHLLDSTLGAQELQADQLRNAIVIIRLSPAPGVDPTNTPPRMALAALFSPASPAAAVILVAEEEEADLWHYAADIARKGVVSLASGSSGGGQAAPPFFLTTSEAAERLIGASLAEAREPRTDLGTFTYSLQEQVASIDGWNVAAIVPGSDPGRAGEYVGLGAHYDHVGVGAPIDGDSIYNGADDNASGTTALLEIAERLAYLPPNQRPARSVLFVWKTAEEVGLLGSEYFTDRPTVPRESIIAHINLDMVGRNHPDSIFSVGSRRIASELGDILETVNEQQSQPFIIDYSYDAPGHPEQVYCRSDHYNYARYGIPIVFLTTGLHDDYHAPSDRPELLDYEKLARVSSLVYDLTVELANRPARPRVDQPVPPLGTPCS